TILEAAVALLDLVGQRPAHLVVLEEERHRVAVAERVVDRHQLHAGPGPPGQDRPVERTADPAEAVDAHTYCHGCSSWGIRGLPGAYKSPSRAFASAPGSWMWPLGPATSAATGSTPSARTAISSAARSPPSWQRKVSTRAPWSMTARRWSVAS